MIPIQPKKQTRILQQVLLALGLIVLMTAAAEACPTCKEGIADGGNGANLVRGYGWSIVFMMSMPFLIFSSLCCYFYYEVVKARRAAETGLAS